jgi:hypothetical protein
MIDDSNPQPLLESVPERLAHSSYDAIRSIWVKAIKRLDEDRDGSITSARSMLETTCNLILHELDIEKDGAWDLPKLYHIAAQRLGISPTQHTDPLFRSVFGASQTIVTRVGELRNKLGDAHGKAHLSLPLPRHHAELAISLAGSISCFLISCLESTIATKKLLTRNGDVILKFDIATVWRLVDHARNSKNSLPWYGTNRPKRALWLVGDSGVYLMSNGSPPIDDKGNLITKKKTVGIRRLTAPAYGCDPEFNAFEDWWSVHNAIDGGNDFSIPISIKAVEKVLPSCKSQIVLLVNASKYSILSDVEFSTA